MSESTRAFINVQLPPRRMLTKPEAIMYCRRPKTVFLKECPASPVEFPNGDMRYDMRDLDSWLDNMKSNQADEDIDAMLDNL